MASKINPKGIFKSNSRSKGPNPKGINPGGINNKPAPKPAPKPSNTKLNNTSVKTSGKSNLPAAKGNTNLVKSNTKSNLPAVKGNTTPTKNPVKGNTGMVKSSGKTTVIPNSSPSKQKKISYKGVEEASKTRTRGGVSKGNSPGTSGKYANKTSIKAPSKANLPAVKGTSTGSAVKSGPSKINFGNVGSKLGKYGKYVKGAGRIAGKFLAPVAAASTLVDISTSLHDTATNFAKELHKKNKKAEEKKKGTSKPDAKKSERTSTLIKTPSLKDELKKRVGDTKPVKDNPKTNWLDTAKKGNTLKYGIDAPKSKKDDSKKGSLPKAIDKAVRAADGNQPGDGSSLKFTGDRSKVAGKDKWGRSPSDKWYGFNPDKKKYEAPTMVKADTKKAETKPVVKTTPVKKPTTTPKVSTTVDKMEMKPTAPIANTAEAKKEIVQPKAAATTSSASSSSSSSTTPSSSASTPKTQPRATFGNKVRGALNASRERRAERAESRGNEGRADKLRDKIEDTSKKMVMRKGGTVRKSKKK